MLDSAEGVGGSVIVDGLSQLLVEDVMGRGDSIGLSELAKVEVGCSKSHGTPCLVQLPHRG